MENKTPSWGVWVCVHACGWFLIVCFTTHAAFLLAFVSFSMAWQDSRGHHQRRHHQHPQHYHYRGGDSNSHLMPDAVPVVLHILSQSVLSSFHFPEIDASSSFFRWESLPVMGCEAKSPSHPSHLPSTNSLSSVLVTFTVIFVKSGRDIFTWRRKWRLFWKARQCEAGEWGEGEVEIIRVTSNILWFSTFFCRVYKQKTRGGSLRNCSKPPTLKSLW